VTSVGECFEDQNLDSEDQIHHSQSQERENNGEIIPQHSVVSMDSQKEVKHRLRSTMMSISESHLSLSSCEDQPPLVDFDEQHGASSAVRATSYFLKMKPGVITNYVEKRRLPPKLTTFCENIVSSRWFELMITAAILLSSIFTVLATQHYLSSVINHWKRLNHGESSPLVYQQPMWMRAWELTFAGVFLIELIIRILAKELQFICGHGVKWNVLDSILVVSTWMDILISFGTGSSQTLASFRVIRVLRVMRSLRIIRVLHIFRELRIVLLSLLGCIVPLFWALVCLFVLAFVFVMFFIQGIGEFVSGELGGSMWVTEYVLDEWSDFGTSLLSCMKMITGGKEWAQYYELMHHISSLHSFVLIVYVLLMTFGALNVVTGTFVEHATTKARQDFEVAKFEASVKGSRVSRRLIKLFRRLDQNDSGTITLAQWKELAALEDVQACFTMLDIDISKTEEVFKLLDIDGSGELDMEEFINGCTNVQGVATHVDVECLAHFIKSLNIRTIKEMSAVKEDLLKEVARLDRTLDQILGEHVKSMANSSCVMVDRI